MRHPVPALLKCRFALERLDAAAACQAGILLARGDGTAGYPEDIALWSEAFTESEVDDHTEGAWLRFGLKNSGFADRLRLFTTPGAIAVGPDSPATFPFVEDRFYDLTVTLNTASLEVGVRDTVTDALLEHVWPVDLAFLGGSPLNVLLRARNMQARFAALEIHRGGSEPPPSSAQAVNDSFTLQGAGPHTLNVLANDTPLALAKSIASVTQPANGTVAIAAEAQRLTFTKTGTFQGSNSFSYQLTGGSAATVSLSLGEAPTTPGGWVYTEANVPGGPPGSGGQVIVSNQTFTTAVWMNTANRDYVDCTFTGRALRSDSPAANIRLFNPTIRGPIELHNSSNNDATYAFYTNLGRNERRHGFVIFGGRSINLNARFWSEPKGYDPAIINHDFTQANCPLGIKIRHGLENLIVGCVGLPEVSTRGHNHAIVNCQGTVVVIDAGNLPGESDLWVPRFGIDGKYPRSERVYCAGVQRVVVGNREPSLANMPALNCVMGIGQAYTTDLHQGTQQQTLANFAAVRAL
jgi:hypothetical protein